MPDGPSPAAPLPALHGIGRRFRPSWRLLLAPLFWATPLAVGAGLALFHRSVLGNPYWLYVGTRMAVVDLAILYGAALFYLLCFPMHVGPDGVRSHTFWGTPSLLRWDEITAARTWSLLGLAYVLITPGGQWWRTLWAPGVTEDPAGFATAVREYGGPDTPVARWLEAEGR